MKKTHPYFVLTLLGYKKTDLKENSKKLKQKYPINKEAGSFYKKLFQKKRSLFLSFPCSHKKHSELYTLEEIYSFLSQDFYPPAPFDSYNLSIPKDLKLEPSLSPQIKIEEKTEPSLSPQIKIEEKTEPSLSPQIKIEEKNRAFFKPSNKD